MCGVSRPSSIPHKFSPTQYYGLAAHRRPNALASIDSPSSLVAILQKLGCKAAFTGAIPKGAPDGAVRRSRKCRLNSRRARNRKFVRQALKRDWRWNARILAPWDDASPQNYRISIKTKALDHFLQTAANLLWFSFRRDILIGG